MKKAFNYECDICHRELDYKKHRLQHQTFTKAPYSKVLKKENIDLCLPCYKRFVKWIKQEQEIFKDC